MTRLRVVSLLAVAVALLAPLAFAQKDGGDAPGAAHAGGQASPSPSTGPAGKESGAGATTTVPAPDVEGEESEHAPSSAPKEKPPPFVKQPTVLKDGMLRVPGGRFTMGSSDKTSPANERPSRAVATPAFWIDKTEVTVGAYKACVDRGACPRPPKTSASCTYDMGDPQLPVSCVPWSSANAYCLAVGKRLPREVEWELAARGTMGARYPWGGTATACGMAATLASERTSRSCSGRKPSRVGAHVGGASPYGVLDMSGNVEEWVSDWYTDAVSELSPRAGASHVLRGGGWLSLPSLARTTTRNWGSVREAGPNVGFRCARDD